MRRPHPELALKVKQALGEIDRTADYLAAEEAEALRRGFGAEFATREIVGDSSDREVLNLHGQNWIERRRALRAGVKALALIAQDGVDVPLAGDEVLGLKVILAITARPAILVSGGRLIEPPTMWADKLAAVDDRIRVVTAAVGRIEVRGNAVGTGFLAGRGLVITNRHVTHSFGGAPASIALTPDGDREPRRFEVTEIVLEHQTLDLALIRVALRDVGGSAPLPESLLLSKTPPASRGKREVYVVGFPHRPPQNFMSAEMMDRLFARVYGVQRLQPGETGSLDPDEPTFTHDCSTLRGNSGSPVLELERGDLVLGLHFEGAELVANRAVSLWAAFANGDLPPAELNWN